MKPTAAKTSAPAAPPTAAPTMAPTFVLLPDAGGAVLDSELVDVGVLVLGKVLGNEDPGPAVIVVWSGPPFARVTDGAGGCDEVEMMYVYPPEFVSSGGSMYYREVRSARMKTAKCTLTS